MVSNYFCLVNVTVDLKRHEFHPRVDGERTGILVGVASSSDIVVTDPDGSGVVAVLCLELYQARCASAAVLREWEQDGALADLWPLGDGQSACADVPAVLAVPGTDAIGPSLGSLMAPPQPPPHPGMFALAQPEPLWLSGDDVKCKCVLSAGTSGLWR